MLPLHAKPQRSTAAMMTSGVKRSYGTSSFTVSDPVGVRHRECRTLPQPSCNPLATFHAYNVANHSNRLGARVRYSRRNVLGAGLGLAGLGLLRARADDLTFTA